MISADTSVLRPDLASLRAYHVPPADGLVKLDAMENPFSLPEALRRELAECLADAPVNRYPDPAAVGLKDALRRRFGIDPRWDILLGNGSDELIQLLIQAVATADARVLSVAPSFVMYRLIAGHQRVAYADVPLTRDFELDREAMLRAVREQRPALTFIAYPNNPTGNAFDRAIVDEIIAAAAPGLVVIDEAYQSFAADSYLERLGDFGNLLILRTLSKLGLAGLRLGYLVGAPALVGEIDKLRLPYNINVLTQRAAMLILEHGDVLERQTAILREERAKMLTALAAQPDVRVYPSEANFVLARVPDAPALHAGLLAAGILVKNLHGAHPLLEHCLRLTIGAPEENVLLLKTLQEALNRYAHR